MQTMHRLATLGGTATLVAASILGSAGAASAAPLTPIVPEPTNCSTGALPVSVIGADGVKGQDALGVYLWHGTTGYALRVTHPGKEKVVFAGSITVSNTISAVHRVALERADAVVVGPYRHTLTFRFTNYGAIDGVNFAAGCSKDVKVSLVIDSKTATTDQVFLGKSEVHPATVPFTIERTLPAPVTPPVS